MDADYNLKNKTIAIDHTIWKVFFWYAGSYAPLHRSYASKDVILFCFDITDDQSWQLVKYTFDYEGSTHIATKDPAKIKILVGTKSDLLDQRKIDKEDIEAFSAKYSIPYFECSAKTGEGVSELFEFAVKSVPAIKSVSEFKQSNFTKQFKKAQALYETHLIEAKAEHKILVEKEKSLHEQKVSEAEAVLNTRIQKIKALALEDSFIEILQQNTTLRVIELDDRVRGGKQEVLEQLLQRNRKLSEEVKSPAKPGGAKFKSVERKISGLEFGERKALPNKLAGLAPHSQLFSPPPSSRIVVAEMKTKDLLENIYQLLDRVYPSLHSPERIAYLNELARYKKDISAFTLADRNNLNRILKTLQQDIGYRLGF